MSGQGPPTLFIYYQKAYKLNDQGDDVEDSYKNAHPEFVVTDGKFELLKIVGGTLTLVHNTWIRFKAVNLTLINLRLY